MDPRSGLKEEAIEIDAENGEGSGMGMVAKVVIGLSALAIIGAVQMKKKRLWR